MTQERLKILYKVNNSNPGTRKALQNRPKEVSSRPATQTSTAVPGVSVAGLSTCRKVLQQQDSAPLRGLGASPQAEALSLGNEQVKGSGSHSNPSRCRRDPRTHLTKANVPQTQIPWGFLWWPHWPHEIPRLLILISTHRFMSMSPRTAGDVFQICPIPTTTLKILFSQHFIVKNFKHTAKLKELYSKHPNTHRPDSTTDNRYSDSITFLSIYPCLYPSVNPSYFQCIPK